MQSVLRRSALFVSYLLHPMVLAVAWVLILLFFYPYYAGKLPNAYKWYLGINSFVYLMLLPVLFIFYLKRKKVVSSMHLPTRKERSPVYSISLMSAGMFSYLVYLSDYLRGALLEFSITMTLTILFLFVLNFFLKASAHAAAAAGLAVSVLFISGEGGKLFLICAVVAAAVAGIVASARLVLDAHTEKEVYAGAAGGISAALITQIIVNYI